MREFTSGALHAVAAARGKAISARRCVRSPWLAVKRLESTLARHVSANSITSIDTYRRDGASLDFQPERYRPLLCLLARRLELDQRFRRRFDSSDLVQETLLKAHQGFAKFRGQTEAELIAWLQQVLERVAADEIRKAIAQKRDISLEQSLEEHLAESSARLNSFLAATDLPLGQQLEQREDLIHLAMAVDQLPDDQRDALIHRDLNGMTISAIAQSMGRTEKSIAGLILRGRKRLRELLQEQSEESDASQIRSR